LAHTVGLPVVNYATYCTCLCVIEVFHFGSFVILCFCLRLHQCVAHKFCSPTSTSPSVPCPRYLAVDSPLAVSYRPSYGTFKRQLQLYYYCWKTATACLDSTRHCERDGRTWLPADLATKAVKDSRITICSRHPDSILDRLRTESSSLSIVNRRALCFIILCMYFT